MKNAARLQSRAAFLWARQRELTSTSPTPRPRARRCCSSRAQAARAAIRRDWLGRFGRDGRLQQFSSPGCPSCGHTGFRGRCGVRELMPISRALRRLIQTGARSEEISRIAMAEGMRSLRQDGIEKVLAGVTTIEEVRATSNA